MNKKISTFVICVEGIIYLLYNLHDCTFKESYKMVKLRKKHADPAAEEYANFIISYLI